MKRFVIFLLLISIFFTSGCYTLRKKFIRKKKYQKEEPVYVGFKDYPTKPSREAYLDYYLFVEGWIDELSDELSDSFSVSKAYSLKRVKRAIKEAIMNLEQIIAFFNKEGKEKIYPLYQDLVKVKESIDKNPNTSAIERSTLLQKVEHFRRRFEADFKYSNAQKWME
ncbi:MAG: hypothetical protein Q8O30_11350 [Candidatus Omnitrophota bacterium]|nr:hypothetical protein [Candidatus Omnitrophota bacterium]